MEKYRLSICTPTYNREELLARQYESLCKQTFKQFEWLIIDDGSTDNTKDRVRSWQKIAPFPIFYYQQENLGRFAALNQGFVNAKGELIAFIDSDDYFLPNALERMLFHWDSIPNNEKQNFAGIAGLCMNTLDNLIGTRFPKDIVDSNSIEIRIRYNVKGDKTNCYRADLLRENLCPIFEGERRVPTSLLFNRLARFYKTRFVNEIWVVKDYLADGITKNLKALVLKSPHTTRLFHQEILRYHPNTPFKKKIFSAVNYVRYSMHCRISLHKQITDCSQFKYWLMALPLGTALYLRDHHRYHTIIK